MNSTQPMPESEWSSLYSGDPPRSLKETVDEVVTLVRGITITRGGPGSFAIPDRPRLVSIFGTRGQGKSTTLHFSAHELRSDPNHLVLPVIDPEAFAPGDSFSGWVLAYLDKILTEQERRFEPESSAGRSLEQILLDLRRAQAVRAAEYLPGLGRRGLSFDDFARDAMKIPAHGVRMSSRLANLLDALAEARGTPELKLIVAVDDADLFPELLPGIVSDAQMLGSSARVTVLFAADPRTLAQSLQIGYLSTHAAGATTAMANGLLEAQEVRELVGRRLVKHFPRSLRVQLAAMGADQRLSFRPLDGGGKSLLDLLSRFPIGDGSGRTLASLFKIESTSGETLAISPYALALSSNARDLRQLHEALSVIDTSSENASSRALGVIMEHGLEGLQAEIPSKASDVIQLEGSRERLSARFDFTDVQFGKGTVGGVIAYARPADEAGGPSEEESDAEREQPISPLIVLRRVDRHYARLDDHAGDREGLDESPLDPDALRSDLPDQFTHLVLLAWEAIQGPEHTTLLASAGYIGEMGHPGGRGWVDITSGSTSSIRWSYWTVPLWDEYSDYFIFQEGWNRLIRAIRELHQVRPTTPVAGEIALLAHLHLVASVQLHRAVPDWIASLDRETLGDLENEEKWQETRARMQAEIGEQLEDALSRARLSEATRADDFVSWFSRYLPLAATPLLTTQAMSSWLIKLWEAHTSVRAKEESVQYLSVLAGEHINSYVGDGDVELLEWVEDSVLEVPRADRRSQHLRNLRDEYRQRNLQAKNRIIQELQKGGADSRLIGNLRSEGATKENLLALMQIGLKPEDISTIIDAFPTVTGDPEETREVPGDSGT